MININSFFSSSKILTQNVKSNTSLINDKTHSGTNPYSSDQIDIDKINVKLLQKKRKLGDLVNISGYNDYILLCAAGNGAYGIVFKIFSEKGLLGLSASSFLAIKFDFTISEEITFHGIIDSRYLIDSGKTEIKQDFHSLIRFDRSMVKNNTVGYIIMKTADCDLNHIIKKKAETPINSQNIAYLLYSLTNGLNYYHKKNIAHRDIKPHNILIMNNFVERRVEYILSDFSSWIKVENGRLVKTLVGTPGYIAPELIEGKDYLYDPYKADIYSLGITCLEMLIDQNTQKKLKQSMKDKQFDDIITIINELNIDNNLKNLFLSMLTRDPEKRISIDDLLSEIKNLSGYNSSYQQNISRIIFDSLQNGPSSPDFVDEKKICYKILHTTAPEDIFRIMNIIRNITNGDNDTITKLLNSNNDLELKVLGILYYLNARTLPRQ